MPEQDAQAWAPSVLRDVGEDDSDVYIVGVRETTDDNAWSLIFMEPYDDDDDDDDDDDEPDEIDLGMDTYCLVVDPGQATHYGGIQVCELDGETLRLVLTEEAARTLGMPVETRFALELTPEQLDVLRRGLARVLASGRPGSVPQLRL